MKRPNFQIRPSRYLASFLLLAHGGTLLILLFLNVIWWAKLMISPPILISFFMLFRYHVTMRAKNSVLALKLKEDSQWELKTRSGKKFTAHILGNSVVMDKLLVINFRTEKPKKNISVVLFTDSIDKEDFRHMKIWLRQL